MRMRSWKDMRRFLIVGALLSSVACTGMCDACNLGCKVSKLAPHADKLKDIWQELLKIGGIKVLGVTMLKIKIDEEHKKQAPAQDLAKKRDELSRQLDRLIDELKDVLDKKLPGLPKGERDDLLKQAKQILLEYSLDDIQKLLNEFLRRAETDRRTAHALREQLERLAAAAPGSPAAAGVRAEIDESIGQLMAVQYHDIALHLVRTVGFLEKCSGIALPNGELATQIRDEFPDYPRLLPELP